MKCFCIQTEIIKDFGWNAVQRRWKGGQSPLPLTLQRRCLMCFKSDSLTGLSPGLQPRGLVRQLVFRLQKVSLWILFTEMLFLEELLPRAPWEDPRRTKQTLHRSLSLAHALSHFFEFAQTPGFVFQGCASTQKHKQYSVHALGKINSQHTGAKTHPKTSTDKYSRVRAVQLSKTP